MKLNRMGLKCPTYLRPKINHGTWNLHRCKEDKYLYHIGGRNETYYFGSTKTNL